MITPKVRDYVEHCIGYLSNTNAKDPMTIGRERACLRNRVAFCGDLRLNALTTKTVVVFCDGQVESPTLKSPFEDTSDAALARWNRNPLPHRDRLEERAALVSPRSFALNLPRSAQHQRQAGRFA